MASDYRKIRSLHPEIQSTSLEDKLQELKNNADFIYFVDRIYSQIVTKQKITKMLD